MITSHSDISKSSLLEHTRSPWPNPGLGRTHTRWKQLAALARLDLPLAKLVEPHQDALAIMEELGGEVHPGQVWAVWAAEPPFAVLEAKQTREGWFLSGTKAYCSGADLVTHALVTASTDAGSRLFAIALSGDITEDTSRPKWIGAGMIRARTSTLILKEVPAEPVGSAAAYVDRLGFWWGAIGIAAAWFGGAQGVADLLETADHLDPHGLAHRGAIRSELETLKLTFQAAANRVDNDSIGLEEAERLALAVRARTAATVEEVISRVGRALGPAPLAFNADHAARVADLQVFVRQHHGERDLARLGSLSSDDG